MAMAYLLIKTISGYKQEVYDKLSHIPEILEAISLDGEYSLIVKIVAENYETIGKITMEHIRKIDNVVTLEILPVIESPAMIQVVEETI